jgi:tetratricopeptide (TPR) repeat protein
MFLVASAAAEPVQLPDELSHLNALASQEKELVEAARAYDKAQSLLADAELQEEKQLTGDAARAKHSLARARFKRIRTAYEFVLGRYPGDVRAKTYYGELLYDRFGEFGPAVKHWEEAVILEPRLSLPYNDLGIHYCHNGEYVKGLQFYDKALELDPDNPDYLFNIVQTYLNNYPDVQQVRQWKKKKVYHEAMKLSEKAARLLPNDFDLARDYATNFFAAQNFGVNAHWKDAAEAWQRARGIARNDAERFNAWLNEGRVWLQDGDKAKARACLDEALKLQPESPVAKQLIEDLSSGPRTAKDHPEKPSPK